MTQVCTGVCERYKKESIVSKLKNYTTSLPANFRYQSGQKWCTLCSQFFFTKEILCPCCRTRLRSKPRTKRYELPRI